MPVEKPKDFKGTIEKRLVGFLKPYRGSILVVFGMAILSTVFSVAGPKILGNSITILFEGVMKVAKGVPGAAIDYGRVGVILLSLLGLYLVASGFSYATQLVMAGVSQKTVYSLRKAIDEKLARLPLSYFDQRTHGEILSRVTNDVDTISTTLQQSVTQAITSVVSLVGYIIMMLTISWELTLVALATLPLYIMATTLVAKRSQVFSGQQKELGDLTATSRRCTRATRWSRPSATRIGQAFDEINDRLSNVAWKAQFVSGIIMPVMNFINNIGYVLICGDRRHHGDQDASYARRHPGLHPVLEAVHPADHPDGQHRQRPPVDDRLRRARLRGARRGRGTADAPDASPASNASSAAAATSRSRAYRSATPRTRPAHGQTCR